MVAWSRGLYQKHGYQKHGLDPGRAPEACAEEAARLWAELFPEPEWRDLTTPAAASRVLGMCDATSVWIQIKHPFNAAWRERPELWEGDLKERVPAVHEVVVREWEDA